MLNLWHLFVVCAVTVWVMRNFAWPPATAPWNARATIAILAMAVSLSVAWVIIGAIDLAVEFLTGR